MRGARTIILDEPTAVLTPQESRELFQTLRGFVAQGMTVLFISHHLEEVMEVSDTVTVLRHGQGGRDPADGRTVQGRSRPDDGRPRRLLRPPAARARHGQAGAGGLGSLGARRARPARRCRAFRSMCAPARSSALPALPAMARPSSPRCCRACARPAMARSQLAGRAHRQPFGARDPRTPASPMCPATGWCAASIATPRSRSTS